MHAESQATQEGVVEILAQIRGEDGDALILLPLVVIGPSMLILSPESGSHPRL